VAIDLWPKIMVGEFLLRGIRNIRVVGIAPGYTETGLLAQMNQEALKTILQDVHLGRLVRPEEIADMIGYCVKNAALNATTIEITGGLCYPKGIAK
jgi:3-oxoacyl-[acyl-carrier protein] reductase